MVINRKGSIVIELLIILAVMAITSAVVLLLINSGVISLRTDYEPVQVLNTEFLPVGRAGHLAVREFSFCENIDRSYVCVNQKDRFNFGDEIHFKFVLETSTADGEVLIVKNYKIKGPNGALLLDADAKDNFYFEIRSKKERELITFKDFFILLGDGEKGEYVLELVLENPLIDKRTVLVERFMVQ